MGFPRVLAVLAAVTALVAGCGHTSERPKSAPATSSAAKAIPPARPACGQPAAILAAMSTRDKLAQLLMVGVRSGDDAKDVVANHHVGGIFIGSWTDLSMLTNGLVKNLAASTALPVAVSVDEEGGRVARLSSLIGPAPSARVLAQTHTAAEVYGMALDRGHRMRGLGITVDFAPVVDVTDAADDTVIGDRSFSSDPAKVTEYSGAYARGLRDAGLLPVLKHFPGHGHGSGDSHTGGVVTPPLDQLQNDDLVPYRTLVTAAPVGVMVGHLQVPGLTGNEPASLSRAAVQLLRTGTGYNGPAFDGPVFSDDLSSMAAINERYSVPDAVLRTLQAGTDVALWVTTDEVPAVLDRLEKALAAGELTMPAVDASVLRVAKFKRAQARLRAVTRRRGYALLTLKSHSHGGAEQVAANCDENRTPTGAQAPLEGDSMAGGTKRLPRAVREQQMLDAAVQMFSINGYHDTSMDAIAAKAEISKPMLYLYYGSKEELFAACLDREMTRFIDGVREDIDLEQSPKDLLRNTIVAFMRYIDANRASWIVMYAQATNSQAFAHTVREGRERIIAMVARLLQAGTRNPEPDADFDMVAVALVGAGEAVATRLSTGDTDVDGAAELMINLFWRGLKGAPSDRDAAEAATGPG